MVHVGNTENLALLSVSDVTLTIYSRLLFFVANGNRCLLARNRLGFMFVVVCLDEIGVVLLNCS